MTRVFRAPLLLGGALALLGSCGKAETDRCQELACSCPGSGFSYEGQCVNGALVCECPDATPRAATCELETCASSYGMPRGSWRLVGACPRQLTASGACNGVSEVLAPTFEGALNFDRLSSTIQVRATLVSDQSPMCGASCAAIEEGFFDPTVRCVSDSGGRACSCRRELELRAETAFVLGERTTILWANGEQLDARYCEEGDQLILSAPELELKLVRAQCLPGQTSCDGQQVLECDVNAELVVSRTCSGDEACYGGRCLPACAPGSLFCTDQGEQRCADEGVKTGLELGARCAEGIACVASEGCQGPREVPLGFASRGSLTNVAFAGHVVQASQNGTLSGFAFDFTTYGPSSLLEWRVYEARYELGFFEPVWAASQNVGPAGGLRAAPTLSVPLLEGRYYLLAVGVPPTVNFTSSSPPEQGLYVEHVGVVYMLDEMPSGSFNANGLAGTPEALLGNALITP